MCVKERKKEKQRNFGEEKGWKKGEREKSASQNKTKCKEKSRRGEVRDPRDQCGSQWRRLNTTLGVVLDDIN